MIAAGFGIMWAGYTLGMWGYCLLKGYDVTFGQLFASTWPGAQVAATAPTAGHQLGTITGNAQVTSPAQLQTGSTAGA